MTDPSSPVLDPQLGQPPPTPVPAGVDPTGYATVDDYELRTGATVPPNMTDTYQTWLNDASALMRLYMGEECADKVEAAYPDVLTSLTCQRVYRMSSTPAGITSASVGGTSVSYANASANTWLSSSEIEMLDRLMDAACGTPLDVPGIGEVAAGWAGGPPEEDPDVVWLNTGPARWSR